MRRLVAELELTLAFERLVDGLLRFQQQRGELPAGEVAPIERMRLRVTLVQLLNELDPRVRAAADERCAGYLRGVLPILASSDPNVIAALVADGLEDYRRGLRQVPLRGVGEFA